MEERLRKQIEFYFSDSNLSKDAYMRGVMKESQGGWVPISTFLSFNKIKAITTETSEIQMALEKSQVLVLNEDKSCVKRREAYVEKEIPASHYIYVEHLSPRWDHDFVRSLFSQVGEVLHVSLPRDKKTRLFRGFGFVEFATEEDAKRALILNGHSEPSWISELTVMLKTEWMDRKRELQQLHAVKRPSPEVTPHILLSNVPKEVTSKQLRNLLTMMGPVVYVQLWNGEKEPKHPLVQETTCIVRFQTLLGSERCLYLLEKHKQFMTPGKALEARKLTEDEERFFEREGEKRGAAAAEREDKRLKTYCVWKKQDTTRKATISPPPIKEHDCKHHEGDS